MRHYLVVCMFCSATLKNIANHYEKKHPKSSSSDKKIAKEMDVLYMLSPFQQPEQYIMTKLPKILGLKVEKRFLCPACCRSTCSPSNQTCIKKCGKQKLLPGFMQQVRAPCNMLLFQWRLVDHVESQATPTTISDLASYLSGRNSVASTAANHIISTTNAFFTSRYSGTVSLLQLTN